MLKTSMEGRSKKNLIDRVITTHPPLGVPTTMRLLRNLSVVLLLAGCASVSGQAQNDQPTHQTTDREWPVSAHYDGKRFYNTSGADKGAGDISKFLWQNLWNKEGIF